MLRNPRFYAIPPRLIIGFVAVVVALSWMNCGASASSADINSQEKTTLASAIPEFEWSDGEAPSLPLETSDRTPASSSASTRTHQKQRPSIKQRHSRLPMSVNDGFEIKITFQQKEPPLKETSMFWVVKREAKFDLLYATSGGSRSSVSLSPEIFQQLMGQVQGLKPIERDVHRCKTSNIQLSIVNTAKPERQIFSCINEKGSEAQKLTALSQSLAMIVN